MQKLSRQSFFLLILAMLNNAGLIVATTFVNVFLMRSTNNSIGLIILQNMLNFSVLLVAFVGGTKLLAKMNITTILKIGIVSQALYYLAILVLRNHIATFIIPLGIFSGLGGGLYWFATNLLIGRYVKESEQGRFFSYQQTFGFVFGVVIPALSGFLIVQFDDLMGYYILFGIAIVLFISGYFLVGNISGFTAQTKMQVLGVLKLKGNDYWQASKLVNFSNGFKMAVQGMIFTLFAFSIFQNEDIMGRFTSMSALIGVFSSLWFARRSKMNNQKQYYFLTTLFMLVTFLLLAFFPNKISMVVAWVIFGAVQSWGNTILRGVTYQLSLRAKNGFEQNEYIVATEFPLALGRMVGLTFSLLLTRLLNSTMDAYRILFVFIGLCWLFEYLIMDKKVRWFKDEVTKAEFHEVIE
jgi:YQGE family putative transporter